MIESKDSICANMMYRLSSYARLCDDDAAILQVWWKVMDVAGTFYSLSTVTEKLVVEK